MEKPRFWRRRKIDNFDLRVAAVGDRYRAEVPEQAGGGVASSEFRRPFSWEDLAGAFGEADCRDLNAAPRPAAPPVAKDVGSSLFRAVFDRDVYVEWCLRLQRSRRYAKDLRLRLRLNSADVWDWPWELLHDPQLGFLAMLPRTPVVRYMEMPVPAPPLKVKPPLRILAVAASPEGSVSLDVEQELTDLANALDELDAFGRVELERLARPTGEALLQKLRNEPFHVLHFIGHGTFDPERGGMILLENEDGSPDFMDSERLRVLLAAQPQLRLVILNACQGARGHHSDPWAGLQQSLIRSGLPAVIGMRTAISDRAAKEFSKSFYESLAKGEPVDRSLSYARQAMFALQAGEWATPVLTMQSPDGRLFDLNRWEILWDGLERLARQFGAWIVSATVLAVVLVVAFSLSRIRFDPNLIDVWKNPPECPSPKGVDIAFVAVDVGGRPLCVARYETTQRIWRKVMRKNIRSERRGKALPVTVSREDTDKFLKQLNLKAPEPPYRLPTEHEWRQAAREGVATLMASTAAATANCENKEANDGYENTAPVGIFDPNSWGLYDMRGNVAEWVADYDGGRAVRMGGSYENALENCRPGYRSLADPDRRHADTGFRIVREPVR